MTDAPFDGSEPRPQLPALDGAAPEAVYDYTDEDGRLLYVVCRYPGKPGKKFRQWRLAGAAWRPLGDARRVLFRLPAVLSHIEANSRAPIYVVEGEKDVEAVEAAGGCATCNPMGAGKWRDEYSEALRGARRVVIVADRDQPGENHARYVRDSLAAVGLAAELVQAREGKDAADHLAGDHGLDQFEAVPAEPEAARAEDPPPFIGRSHDEVIELDLPPARTLVDGLIEEGTVGTISGVPETYKSWLALATAAGVSSGKGEILGRSVLAQGAVGYFWQDDSERNEAARVQQYAAAAATPAGLPLRWFLNAGLELPRDLGRLRATIERYGLILVVLDSYYNIARGVSLKEEEAAQIIAALKAEVADPTGCTILIVDHAPWPTDANRGQRRSYGSVFKGAAIRFGIYIEREGSKLHVEAHGNNIVGGLKRTPAYWDEEALELRLVDTSAHEEAEADLDERVFAFLEPQAKPVATSAVREGVPGRNERIDKALERLKAAGRAFDLARDGGAWSGRVGTARYWTTAVQAGLTSPQLFGATSGDLASGASEEANLAPPTTTPKGWGEVQRGEVVAAAAAPEDGRAGRPLLGDEGYDVNLADAARDGFITAGEFEESLAAHRAVALAREDQQTEPDPKEER